MRGHVKWTEALDSRLRGLRLAGLTWDQIAAEMALGRNTVVERGRRIGAQSRRRIKYSVEQEPLDRPPRPAGHPATWGLINRGTVLEDEPYPFPIFL